MRRILDAAFRELAAPSLFSIEDLDCTCTPEQRFRNLTSSPTTFKFTQAQEAILGYRKEHGITTSTTQHAAVLVSKAMPRMISVPLNRQDGLLAKR